MLMANSKMNNNSAFQLAIESVESLSLEDQSILIELIQKRLQQQKRKELERQVQEVRQEYSSGNVKFGSVEDFLVDLDKE
jgi:hypothetical protein